MKEQILNAHGIKAVVLPNGAVIADNDDGTFKNVTNMSIYQLYKWLGY